MGPSTKVPPVVAAAWFAHVIDGDGGVRVPLRDVFQYFQLVGLLDFLYAAHSLLFGDLKTMRPEKPPEGC